MKYLWWNKMIILMKIIISVLLVQIFMIQHALPQATLYNTLFQKCHLNKTLLMNFDFKSDDVLNASQVYDMIDVLYFMNSKQRMITLASMFSCMSVIERVHFDETYMSMNGKRLIPNGYKPYVNHANTYNDLLYSILNNKTTVLCMYLKAFLVPPDEQLMALIFTFVQSRTDFTEACKDVAQLDISQVIQLQKGGFKEFATAVFKTNRDPDSKACVQTEVDTIVTALISESGKWNGSVGSAPSRTTLDSVLLYKSTTCSKTILDAYQTKTKSTLNVTINAQMSDMNLKLGYSYMARYMQYKTEFLADLLYFHLNRDCDNWAVWILIVVTQEDNLKEIGDFYQNKYGKSLSDAVLSTKMNSDHLFVQMMSAMVGPCMKVQFCDNDECSTTPQ